MIEPNHHYTTITLDMGYTLVEIEGSFDRELVALAARYGRIITRDDIRATMRIVWQEQLQIETTTTWEPSLEADRAIGFDIDRRTCLHLGITDPTAHVELNIVARRIFQDPATFRVFPDVFDTLATLRAKGLTLGIISNWSWGLADLCTTLGLSPYFDFILSSARVGAAKPHRAIFEEALRHAAADPAQVLHVGDLLEADVLGAQAVGITGVLLDRRGAARDAGHLFPVVSSLAQLVPLLDGQSPRFSR